MIDSPFTDPATTAEEWIDVRMTDPDEEEWDIDLVIAGGRVEYVDLRVRPELLTPFVECLLDDLDPSHVDRMLTTLADRNDLDLIPGAQDDETA